MLATVGKKVSQKVSFAGELKFKKCMTLRGCKYPNHFTHRYHWIFFSGFFRFLLEDCGFLPFFKHFINKNGIKGSPHSNFSLKSIIKCKICAKWPKNRV